MAQLLLDQEDVGTMTVESLAKIINAQEAAIQLNNVKIENVDLSHQDGTTAIYITEEKTLLDINMANEAVANCESLMQPDPMNELQCQKCGKQFADINTLKSHEVIHEEDCNFLCNVCGEHFDKASALSEHLVIHRSDDIKLHHCEVCDLVFPDEQSLKEHSQVHSRQKVYTCEKYAF